MRRFGAGGREGRCKIVFCCVVMHLRYMCNIQRVLGSKQETIASALYKQWQPALEQYNPSPVRSRRRFISKSFFIYTPFNPNPPHHSILLPQRTPTPIPIPTPTPQQRRPPARLHAKAQASPRRPRSIRTPAASTSAMVRIFGPSRLTSPQYPP